MRLFFFSGCMNNIPTKPERKVLLILDGDVSHVNSVEMFLFAVSNRITLLCQPSHANNKKRELESSSSKKDEETNLESVEDMWKY